MHVEIWNGLAEVPKDLGSTVVTIGVFDGIHRGHQQLLKAAVEQAKDLKIPSVMFTFDPHPMAVFKPESQPKLLASLEQRAQWAEQYGIDYMVVVDFAEKDSELSRLSPEDYVKDILGGIFHARAVIVGDNFSFGHRAAGTATDLRSLGEAEGMDVSVFSLLNTNSSAQTPSSQESSDGDQGANNHLVISSTALRQCISEKKIEFAQQLLGRPFEVRGVVTRGMGRGGKELGFPTANLYFEDKFIIPADGVYAGYVWIDADDVEGTMPVRTPLVAAISVGTNPTFGKGRRSVEAFILDHEANLYGKTVVISFVSWVRDMEKFSGVEELLEAMNRDVARVREILG